MKNKKTITFVTNNEEKISDIKSMLGKEFRLNFISDKDLIEIQSLSVEEVVKYKAKQAYEKIQSPVAVSDSGLEIIALKNFPGALVKYTNETIGQRGIVKLLENTNNRTAFFIAAIAICKSPDEVKVFIEKSEGKIAFEPKGEGWHFDKIFIPKGETKTWAEIGREQKNENSAFKRALKQMSLWLKNEL
ncbi:MAG TPA: non-canonical purine NTP pyrophosphatase [candidate division Zixibacteria bacterium]|nr:non-canonical purine NTP pyrophosphatase [candidate division Zixibacteria bacterium]